MGHKKESEEGEEGKEKGGKKRKREKKGAGATVKNFGSYVQISKLKQSTMLVVGWRTRLLNKLICGFFCAKSHEKFVNVRLKCLDHIPGQVGYEGQWHQSPGANPPYRLRSWGDGLGLWCGPNDVMLWCGPNDVMGF